MESAPPAPPEAMPPAIGEIPGIPRDPSPPSAELAKPPMLLANPPNPILAMPAPAKPPIPPRAAPIAVPTPGISIAMGATTFATFFRLLNVFLNQPNSSKPVIGLRLAMPPPTTYCSGSRSSSLNLAPTMLSNCSSSKASGGKTTSPILRCASLVSPPRPSAASIAACSAIGA